MAASGIFVVDCSVSIAWLFDQQADEYTEAALDALSGAFAVAPRWWNIEVLNVLLTLERRGRLSANKAVELLRHLQRLPVRLREFQGSTFELHALALRHQLSSYDALYLETALATGLPLATRDKALQQAAIESGVGVWPG
ncbi:MAG: type II toxin-antitoxin system VapC family toxin [Betaproteobacteria bacterium]|nr:type II toxin-antitoxin system VapC family toxin [Betaproteobacteria bacterium]